MRVSIHWKVLIVTRLLAFNYRLYTQTSFHGYLCLSIKYQLTYTAEHGYEHIYGAIFTARVLVPSCPTIVFSLYRQYCTHLPSPQNGTLAYPHHVAS